MRDDRDKWDVLLPADTTIQTADLTVIPVEISSQTIISGVDIHTQMASAHGWPDIVTGTSYLLSLRRDRILQVNGPTLTDGWHQDRRQAVSDMTDSYAVLQIGGPEALNFLKRGGELNLQVPSRSVVRGLFGLEVLLYQYERQNNYRLHVQCAHMQVIWQHLKLNL